MPQMGVSVSEGTIVAWRKQPGDWVEYEEAIVDISTDKIDTEVPSPAAGRVTEIVVEAGTTVDVGTASPPRRGRGARPRPPAAAPGHPPPGGGPAGAPGRPPPLLAGRPARRGRARRR